MGYKTICEPVNDKWAKYLPLLYEDMFKWGFTFQLEVIDWFRQLPTKIEASSNNLTIIERSGISGLCIFAKNLKQQNIINEWQYSLIKRFSQTILWKPKYIFYLKCKPETCIKRMIERNRKAENNMDTKLIFDLHLKHEQLFNGDMHQKFCNIKVVTLDANQTKNIILKQVISELEQIQKK